MKTSNWTLFAALLVIFALLIAPALSQHAVQAAGPFTVTTTADSHDAAPGNGACADAGGQCSLRAAIEEANASATPTTINLPAGTYNLTLGALDVAPNGSRTITITGAGPATTEIHQTVNTNRVMVIDLNMMGNVNVTLMGVALTGGGANDPFGGAGILAGSVINNSDSLILTFCRIENNQVSSPDSTSHGGGVRMDGGALTVTNCTFTNNSSGTAAGGAIAFFGSDMQGTLTINGSTFTNNASANTTASGPVGGGAIYMNKAAATISYSTFTANQATSSGAGGAHGGALYFNTGTLSIDHSTFTGNVAGGTYGRGGAIYLDSGALSLTYSRLFGNTASSGGSGVFNHALNGASTTATNDWWGCNGGPTAAGCDQAATDNAGLTVSPWIVLTTSANPAGVHPGQSATLTASFLWNSTGGTLTTANISVLFNRPLTWTDAALGTLSNQQTSIQQASGQATATFTAGPLPGAGGASAGFDAAVVPATVTVLVDSDLTVSKTGPATVVVGNPVTYTITLSNSGPDAAPAVTLSDVLPPGLTFVSQQQTAGPAFTLANTGNTINNSISSLAAGASASFSITATVNASATPGSTLANIASASSAATDPVTANNSATTSATVHTVPAITSDNATPFTVFTPGSFTVTATGYPTPAISLGGALPTGVTFTDNGDGTATLAGTPASGMVGIYPLTITASNATGVNASQNFSLMVQRAESTIAVASSPNPSVHTQAVTFTASVTSPAGTPIGVVQFSVDGSDIGAPVMLSSGTAALTVSTLNAGAHSIAASYSGNSDLNSSSAVPITQIVTPVADLSVSKTGPGIVLTGGTLVYTVTVSNAGPDAALNSILNDGLPPGLNLVSQAQISGPAFTLSASGNVITNSIASLPAGTTAVFAITAAPSAGIPPGTVFTNVATVSGQVDDLNPINNNAFASSTLYTAPAVTSANAASFTLASPGSFTVTATGYPTPAISISGALPTGVSFTDNGDGTASLAGTPAPGTVGNHPLTITASNASGVDASQSFTLTVLPAATTTVVTSSLNPSLNGQAVTFTASVTSTAGTPTGVVQFSADGSSIGAPVTLSSGTATLTLSTLSAGAHSIAASYSGDANFAPSSAAPITQAVTAVAELSVSKTGPAFVLPGGTLVYTVTVSNAGPDAALNVALNDVLPAGLTFVSQMQTSGPAFTLTNTGNTVNNSVAALPAGATASFTITAALDAAAVPGSIISNTAEVASDTVDMNPDNNSATATATVNLAPAITSGNAASFTVGTAGSFTVTATGYPTPAISQSGSLPTGVTFTDNGDGTATLAGTPASSTWGSYPLTITAGNGSGVDASQSFTLTVERAAAAVSVTADLNPSFVGQTVTFTATVTSSAGTPAGMVQFTIDGGASGGAVALSAEGVATFSTNLLAAGTHTVTADYLGDPDHAPASGTLSGGQVVAASATTTTLTAVMGGGMFQPDVLLEVVVAPIASGAGTPAGTVTFTGDLPAPTAVALDASGRASIVVPGAARGNLTFTATYAGNASFGGSNHTVSVFAPHVAILLMVYK